MKIRLSAILIFGINSLFAQYQLKQVIGKTGYPVISDYWRTPVATSDSTIAYSDNKENVLVYERINGQWAYMQTLHEPNSNRNTSYGEFISIENRVMAISDRSTGADEGTVFFYKKQDDNKWLKFDSVHTPLNPSTSSSPYWGAGLRINKGTCPVGRTNGNMTFFHIMRERNDGSWYLADTISTPTMVTGHFENTDSTLFIAGKYFFGLNHIFAYKKNSDGSLNETPQKITIPDGKGVYRMGNDMEAEGDFLFAGSPEDDIYTSTDTVINAGSVFIFKKENGVWAYHSRISAPTSLQSGNFGESVDIKNGELVVGEKGAESVYIYTLKNNTWELTQTITPEAFPSLSSRFGKHVNFAGNDLVISNSFGIHIYNKQAMDCDNVSQGTAFIDPCGRCSEGTTNMPAQESTTNCEPIVGTTQHLNDQLSIYPNPVSNSVIVSGVDIKTLELVSLSGVLLKTTTALTLDIEDIQSGFYLLKVNTVSGDQLVERIIKK